MTLRLSLIIVFLFAAANLIRGQELDSITMTMEDGKVIVRYDFLEGEEGEDYELYLYSSHDNFTKPLQYTTGDVGKMIKPGRGKVIVWDAQKELGTFKGELSLKIKGSKYIPFVVIENIRENQKIKRGQPFEIRWKNNSKAKEVLLKILRYDVPVSESSVIDNTGRYIWDVPADMKAGKGYTIQIHDVENNLREETSSVFTVRRKVPLAYKIVPAAIVAGAVVVILNLNKDEGIPDPPGVPTQ